MATRKGKEEGMAVLNGFLILFSKRKGKESLGGGKGRWGEGRAGWGKLK